MVYGDLQLFDIIIFAGIAAFLIYRLRNILGKRRGFEKNKPELTALCNSISKDEFVLAATIYDQQGILIASSDNWQAHHILGKLPNSTPGISKLKTPFVEPIISDDDRPLGFVAITYLTRSAVATSHSSFHDLGRQVLLMLVITCIFTWQLGRGLKRWQVNRYIRKSSEHES